MSKKKREREKRENMEHPNTENWQYIWSTNSDQGHSVTLGMKHRHWPSVSESQRRTSGEPSHPRVKAQPPAPILCRWLLLSCRHLLMTAVISAIPPSSTPSLWPCNSAVHSPPPRSWTCSARGMTANMMQAAAAVTEFSLLLPLLWPYEVICGPKVEAWEVGLSCPVNEARSWCTSWQPVDP